MTNFYLIAALGALVPDMIKIVEGKYNPSLPDHLKNVNFWMAMIGQILLGFITVFLLKEQIATNVAAAACGFGGATILTKLLASFVPNSSVNPSAFTGEDQDRRFLWYWK